MVRSVYVIKISCITMYKGRKASTNLLTKNIFLRTFFNKKKKFLRTCPQTFQRTPQTIVFFVIFRCAYQNVQFWERKIHDVTKSFQNTYFYVPEHSAPLLYKNKTYFSCRQVVPPFFSFRTCSPNYYLLLSPIS